MALETRLQKSSLDRLKTLDDLADVHQQLREAQDLCTCSARADMILRWLLSRIQISDDFLQYKDVWNLFSYCLRLLPGRKSAAVMGSNGFADAMQRALAQINQSIDTVRHISGLLSICLDLSDSTDGTAMTSTLSMRSEEAAVFCGNWFRQICSCLYDSESSPALLVDANLVDVGIKLWNLRKRSEFDDAHFTANMLAPSLRMITLLHSRTGSATTSKRKRDIGDSKSVPSYVRSLETMVAKHFVLPNRSLFLRNDAGPRSSSRHQNAPLLQLRTSLKLAWNTLPAEVSGASSAFNALFDIVVRSVPMPTPKHRIHEQPWINEVFSSLRDAIYESKVPDANAALAEMLDTVYARNLKISAALLSELARHCIRSEEDLGRHYAWQLVTKICSVDCNLFANTELAELVFSAIQEDLSKRLSSIPAGSGGVVPYLQDYIVIPIVRAFSNTRNVKLFVELWERQLEKTWESDVTDVWSNLDNAFADTMTATLTKDQRIELFEIYNNQVITISTSEQLKADDDQTRHLYACCVLLRAILGGSQDDDILIRLASDLDQLLHRVILLHKNEVIKDNSQLDIGLLDLTHAIFQSWFPLWSISARDDAAVAQTVATIMSSRAMQSALDSKTFSLFQRASSGTRSRISSCRDFLTTVCNAFLVRSQTGQTNTLRDSLTELIEKHSALVLHVMTGCGFLTDLSEETCQAVATAALERTSDQPDPELRDRHLIELRAAIAAAASVESHAFIDQVVVAATEALSPGPAEAHRHTDESAVVSALAAIPVSMLTQRQREQITDIITRLPPPDSAATDSSHIIQQRLSILKKMVSTPVGATQLMSDASLIWRLASDTAKVMITPQSYELSLTLQIIAREVFSFWVRHYNQKIHRDMIVHQSMRVRRCILDAKHSQHDFSNSAGDLIIVSTALQVFGTNLGEKLTFELAHRDQEAISTYLEVLAQQVTQAFGKGKKSKAEVIETEQVNALLGAFVAIHDFPGSLLTSLSSLERKPLLQIVQIAGQCLHKLMQESVGSQAERDAPVPTQSLIAYCHMLICRHSPGAARDFLLLSEEVLQQALNVKDRRDVSMAIQRTIFEQHSTWRQEFIDSLFAGSRQATVPTLLLRRIVILDAGKQDEGSKDNIHEPELMMSIIDSVIHGNDLHTTGTALQSLALLVKEKPSMLNQYHVERILAAQQEVVTSYPNAVMIFEAVCRILTVMLSRHRSRLQSRFHLLVAVFQSLLSCVFKQGSGSGDRSKQIAMAQASMLSKALMLFCEPPLVRSRIKSSGLVDEARKAQGEAGRYVQYILHHYCHEVLVNTPAEGIRDALLPGVVSVIDAMQVNSADAIKVLSSALNSSERAVLRSVYDEWKSQRWDGTS